MLIFFHIGKWLAYGYIKKSKRETKTTEITPRFKIIYFLILLLLFFTLIDCFIIFKNLAAGVPMSEMRRWRMGAFGIDINPMLARRSFVEEAFRSIILSPFELLITPIAAYYFFSNEKYKKRKQLLGLAIFVIILSSIAGGGGRLTYIYFFGCFLLSYLYFYKVKEFDFNLKKYKKFIRSILIIGLFVILIFTQLRTNSGIIKQTYTYFALPPTLLSLWIPKLNSANHLYGLLTFFGVHSYFFRVLDVLGINFLVPNAYFEAYQHVLNAETFLNVGYGVGNAFVTPIYYFLIDGGIPFICLASVFFGVLTSKLHIRTILNFNVKSFLYYILTMYGVFLTFMRIRTAIPSFIITLAMIQFLFKEKR